MNRLKRVHLFQSVYIRFKDGGEGIAGLGLLNTLVQYPSPVSVDDRDKLAMCAVLTSHHWGTDANRNFQVHQLPWGDKKQVRAMLRYVESMTVGDHGAKGLCSGQQKKQVYAALKLIGAVITDSFVNEIFGWGIDIGTPQIVQPDDPALEFVLNLEGLPIATILLDGFSGRMAVDGVWGEELFNQPAQLQKLIRETMMKKLEAITA